MPQDPYFPNSAALVSGLRRHVLDKGEVNFPPSIVGMVCVFAIFWALDWVVSGMNEFYQQNLKPAADLLNRHMSIGFTVPFIMICRSPFSDARTVGMVIVCFILTGVVNTLSTYALAFPLQWLMVRWSRDSRSRRTPSDTESPCEDKTAQFGTSSLSSREDFPGDTSRATSTHLPGDILPSEGFKSPSPTAKTTPDHDKPPIKPRLLAWTLRNLTLLFSWLITLTTGLPLRYCTQNDTFLATQLLFSLWLSTLAVQEGIKCTPFLGPKPRTLLSGLLNPVLCTSLLMISYLVLDGVLSDRPLQTMLDTLSTVTVTTAPHASNPPPPSPSPSPPSPPTTLLPTAGQIATSVLNAGLVAWGLKLYEYRRVALFARGGATVAAVSALLALGNLACGPAVARAVFGVSPPPRALAFAARSVTLALADPVMASLGGDAGLNAAMVVVSGILWQIGLGLGFVERLVVGAAGKRMWTARISDVKVTMTREQWWDCRRANDPHTVAAGVTVGINAAAMGTAYLYEAQSDAAPYAALSMMALGVMTVGFSAIPPLTRWVVQSVSA
ncbi:hypothetical protein N656DRAFT_786522 [Canariomyces notabilis]|uniref:LrgB-like protein n=1 Tax=Canariomyces notabilis TaxID=2074819 RepID=A0AAN6TKK6_9PEZI|nr:hypothetical protein N656DRAFT_786522 [Canariomyces arenarius]